MRKDVRKGERKDSSRAHRLARFSYCSNCSLSMKRVPTTFSSATRSHFEPCSGNCRIAFVRAAGEPFPNRLSSGCHAYVGNSNVEKRVIFTENLPDQVTTLEYDPLNRLRVTVEHGRRRSSKRNVVGTRCTGTRPPRKHPSVQHRCVVDCGSRAGGIRVGRYSPILRRGPAASSRF